jgi:superfamily II DNA/RNA helicase
MRLYRDGVVAVIIATDLAARGLDVDGLNLVINFDAPRNGIDYIHRIGRTGRADEQGRTVVLVDHREWNIVAGIQRFLQQKFVRRAIEGVMGAYNGPKKLKASGQAAGSKSKDDDKKIKKDKPKVKIRDKNKRNIGKRRVPTAKIEQTDTN